MTSTGMRKQIRGCLGYITVELMKRFERRTIGDEKVFHSNKDLYFKPFSISDFGAVGIEYAQGEDEAKLNRYEDGDLFYLEDYGSYEDLLKDILQEIEG